MKWYCGYDVTDALRALTGNDEEVRVVRPPEGEKQRCEACWFEGRIYGVEVIQE